MSRKVKSRTGEMGFREPALTRSKTDFKSLPSQLLVECYAFGSNVTQPRSLGLDNELERGTADGSKMHEENI